MSKVALHQAEIENPIKLTWNLQPKVKGPTQCLVRGTPKGTGNVKMKDKVLRWLTWRLEAFILKVDLAEADISNSSSNSIRDNSHSSNSIMADGLDV